MDRVITSTITAVWRERVNQSKLVLYDVGLSAEQRSLNTATATPTSSIPAAPGWPRRAPSPPQWPRFYSLERPTLSPVRMA
jgi:hypothetical protein